MRQVTDIYSTFRAAQDGELCAETAEAAMNTNGLQPMDYQNLSMLLCTSSSQEYI